MEQKLTNKQKRFIEEYCVSFNGLQSAIKAGYSKKTAGVIANENLNKPYIQLAISEHMNKTSEKLNITIEDIANNAEFCIKACLEDGKLTDKPNYLKANEQLGKIIGAFIDKQIIKDDRTTDQQNTLDKLKNQSKVINFREAVGKK